MCVKWWNYRIRVSFITDKKFAFESGIEYETSTNDIELKMEDEEPIDSGSKPTNGFSNMLCGVLCKSRLNEVLNENENQPNDDAKASAVQGTSNGWNIFYIGFSGVEI